MCYQYGNTNKDTLRDTINYFFKIKFNNGNITQYIELIVIEFINKIYEKYEEENSWRRLRWK